jgi:hypothetical protein
MAIEATLFKVPLFKEVDPTLFKRSNLLKSTGKYI